MELYVLYDESGVILAAVQQNRDMLHDAAKGNEPTPLPRPVPQSGQYTANVKVPQAFAHLSFVEVCRQLIVEGREGNAVLKPRGSY